MQRRDLLKGSALSALATGLIAPAIAAAEEGHTSSEVESRAAEALAELQKTLDDLEAAFTTPAWNLQTPQDFAEARRLTLHTLLHGLQCWLEGDPARPFFVPFVTPHKKLLGDNPDAHYYSAVIDDQHSYRIRGNLSGATYTSFTAELGTGAEGGGIGSTLNDTQFSADNQGNYEIILSPRKATGNWMPLPKGTKSLTTRHYFENKLSIQKDPLHPVPISIENLLTVPPAAPPDDLNVAAGIRRVTQFVRGNIFPLNAGTSPSWVSRIPNQFPQPVQDDSLTDIGYAAKDNVYSMAPFVLGPDQALLIRGKWPKCRFANVVLFNRFLQSFNYLDRTVSLNRTQTKQDADGGFEMVLAHRDPGHPNWLETEGRPFGIVFWRFQLPEEDIEPLQTQVVTVPS
ncbi:MAG: DUF1214 domain-containing protein [Pseudomonadota bacterium]